MKRILLSIAFLILTILLTSCSSNEDDGKIHLPISSNDLKDANYQDIVAEFENAGFTNIQTEAIEDLLFGWLTKDGEIEQVSVNGYTTFSTDNRYPADTEIIVTYHTFPADEEEEIIETPTSVPAADIKPTATATFTEEPQPTVELEIITVDNNEDFAALLNSPEPSSQTVKEFVGKYAGRIIEFDGNIAYMSNHGDYSTRFDFLIYAWNYSESTVSGPSLQFEDCSVFEINLIGDSIPESIGMGDNLHFVARIIDYDESSQLIHLDPISTQVR